MKLVQTSIFAIVAFFLATGISFGAELDDLDITIRVVESDDLAEMHNELSLPEAAADTAREHTEDDDGRGLNQANDSRAKEHEEDREDVSKDEKEYEEEAREEREDEIEDHDEAREDSDDVIDEHDEAQEEETHEEEHENQDDSISDSGS
jgi:hypothetical protein